ncbi:nucleoside-diphosphate-sugar epimerase [Saccharothrix ecbatanensis]|uniref:Nucleoside-diphosphate-sugar epimerase n=1 Tax=Saccharothrix ecbatanensis TaxID=1105145 RepID=A0A7W9HH56_9PSEU|nr:NAD(P)-dependent oxidoreductase [Saccharothrix ecbatanensis]MBB5802110.1 nucleoside-diphosphate-sugar epimerase [Saccharothrix ecbatanensis]
MRVLVTGAHGKLGAATVEKLVRSGHEVTGVDLAPPVHDRSLDAAYFQADLADAGQVAAIVPGHDAVVHAAAVPSPKHHPSQVIFQNNVMSTYHLVEAAERAGARRFVFISSETVPGFSFPKRYFHADYAPIDEEHRVRPQDPYALSKRVGEELMDAVTARSDLTAVSIRPTWIQWEGNIERNIGPVVRARGSDTSASFWSYVVVYDVADLIEAAATADTPGHEVVYAAAADNVANLPLHDLVRRHFGDEVELRPVARVDASGISCAKAARLFGWKPVRHRRDWLDDDGHLLPEVRERLDREDTGVHRGLRAIR